LTNPVGAAAIRRARIGLLDHVSGSLGGAQLVLGRMAATLSLEHDVEFIHRGNGYSLGQMSSAFELDLSRVKERTVRDLPESFNLPGERPFFSQLLGNRPDLSRRYELYVYSGHGVPPICFAPHGIVYCHFPMESAPERRDRVSLRGSAYQWIWERRMKSYQKLLVNSSFTAHWVERRWARTAEVVYPPVGVRTIPCQKRNLIVSVGRFTASRRTKNQLAQVMAFRDFFREVGGDWTLCCVGSCGPVTDDQEYLQTVRDAAEGLRVSFLVNEPREALERAIAEAKIFWHTTGLAVDEEAYPQQAEHFGIATVEAMCAGCVPVVIGAGGQREIIEDGKNGFLCASIETMVRQTVRIARDGDLLTTMSEQAQRRSRDFSNAVFDCHMRKITSECLERPS
jgi:glycosyltransferase involved in cell wall biosynthesis